MFIYLMGSVDGLFLVVLFIPLAFGWLFYVLLFRDRGPLYLWFTRRGALMVRLLLLRFTFCFSANAGSEDGSRDDGEELGGSFEVIVWNGTTLRSFI